MMCHEISLGETALEVDCGKSSFFLHHLCDDKVAVEIGLGNLLIGVLT